MTQGRSHSKTWIPAQCYLVSTNQQSQEQQQQQQTPSIGLSHGIRIWGIPWTSLVAQTVKRLPTMREARVQSLGREDLLEKEMATHSSILAWKVPWTEEPGTAAFYGVAKSRTRLSDFTFFFLSFVLQPSLNYSS